MNRLYPSRSKMTMYLQESDNRFSRSNQFLYCHENENFRFLHQEYRLEFQEVSQT